MIDTLYEAKTDEDDDVEQFTLEEATESIGFGKFHVLLFLGVGLFLAFDSMETMVMSILSPILKCEWNLSSLEEAMISTVVFIGLSIGAVLCGYLSDVFGRKKIICGSAFIVVLFGVSSSQAPSYYFMLLCRGMVGFGLGAFPQVITLLTEMLPVRRRGGTLSLVMFFWSVGACSAVALALTIDNVWSWRYYLLILASPLLVFLIGSWWLPESPRWLLISGRHKELNALVKQIATTNGVRAPENSITGSIVSSRGRISDLFTKEWIHTTSLLGGLWFTSAFCYYGIPFLTTGIFQSGINGCGGVASLSNATTSRSTCKKLTSEDYIDLMLTTLAEIPGLLIGLALIDLIGRRLTLAILFGSGSISMALLGMCFSRNVLVVLIFLARAIISAAVNTVYIYSAEVYPTNVRSVGVGFFSMIAKLGCILTPFVAQMLIEVSFYAVVGLYAGSLVIAMLASVLLEIETNQKALADYSGLQTCEN